MKFVFRKAERFEDAAASRGGMGIETGFSSKWYGDCLSEQDDELFWKKRAGLREAQCVRLPGSMNGKRWQHRAKTDRVRFVCWPHAGRQSVRELFTA